MYRFCIGILSPTADLLFITHTFYREKQIWSIEILSFG